MGAITSSKGSVLARGRSHEYAANLIVEVAAGVVDDRSECDGDVGLPGAGHEKRVATIHVWIGTICDVGESVKTLARAGKRHGEAADTTSVLCSNENAACPLNTRVDLADPPIAGPGSAGHARAHLCISCPPARDGTSREVLGDRRAREDRGGESDGECVMLGHARYGSGDSCGRSSGCSSVNVSRSGQTFAAAKGH